MNEEAIAVFNEKAEAMKNLPHSEGGWDLSFWPGSEALVAISANHTPMVCWRDGEEFIPLELSADPVEGDYEYIQIFSPKIGHTKFGITKEHAMRLLPRFALKEQEEKQA